MALTHYSYGYYPSDCITISSLNLPYTTSVSVEIKTKKPSITEEINQALIDWVTSPTKKTKNIILNLLTNHGEPWCHELKGAINNNNAFDAKIKFLEVFPMLKKNWEKVDPGRVAKFTVKYSKFVIVTFTTDGVNERVNYSFESPPKERLIQLGPVKKEIFVVQPPISVDFYVDNNDEISEWLKGLVENKNLREYCETNNITPERIKECNIKTPHIVITQRYDLLKYVDCLIRPIFAEDDEGYERENQHIMYCNLARTDYTGDYSEYFEGDFFELATYKSLFTMLEKNKVGPPAPIPAPVPIEVPAPAPAPAPIEVPAPAPAPAPIEVPAPAPAPAPIEVPAPVPAPVSDDYVMVPKDDMKKKLDDLIKQRDELAKRLADL